MSSVAFPVPVVPEKTDLERRRLNSMLSPSTVVALAFSTQFTQENSNSSENSERQSSQTSLSCLALTLVNVRLARFPSSEVTAAWNLTISPTKISHVGVSSKASVLLFQTCTTPATLETSPRLEICSQSSWLGVTAMLKLTLDPSNTSSP